MTGGATTTGKLRQSAAKELKEFAILTAYLYITLGAVILLRSAALHTQASSRLRGVLPS